MKRKYGKAAHVEVAAVIFALQCGGGFVATLYMTLRAHIRAFARPAHLLLVQAFGGLATFGGLVAFVTWLGAVGAAVNYIIVHVSLVIICALLLRQAMRLKIDRPAALLALAGSAAVAAVCLVLRKVAGGDRAWVIAPSVVDSVVAYSAVLRGRLTHADVELALAAIPPTGRAWARRGLHIALRPLPDVTSSDGPA